MVEAGEVTLDGRDGIYPLDVGELAWVALAEPEPDVEPEVEPELVPDPVELVEPELALPAVGCEPLPSVPAAPELGVAALPVLVLPVPVPTPAGPPLPMSVAMGPPVSGGSSVAGVVAGAVSSGPA